METDLPCHYRVQDVHPVGSITTTGTTPTTTINTYG